LRRFNSFGKRFYLDLITSLYTVMTSFGNPFGALKFLEEKRGING